MDFVENDTCIINFNEKPEVLMFKKTMAVIGLITCIIFSFNSAVFANPYNNNASKPGIGDSGDSAGKSDSSNNSSSNSSLNIFNVKGIKSGLIKVDKNIFYSSDTIDISVVFPKSLKSVWDGSSDAYIVIRTADGTLFDPFPVFSSGQTPDKPKTFVSLDLSSTPIPAGDYQVAMILVNPGGDALNLGDWYNGFSGLISATTFKINTECDPLDTDCDGLIDVTGLTAGPSSISLAPGGTKEITIANGQPPYSIVSDDETIGTVSDSILQDDGIVTVTGMEKGTTTITVTDDNGDSAVVDVTVMDATPITVNPVSASLEIAETETVDISGGVGGYTATSSDDTVATVSVSGDQAVIEGIGAGDALITITDADLNSVDVDVTVN
jgi:hypothetical protein